MDKSRALDAVDYIVVALILIISLGIGVLFAVKDFRNANRVEYLLGGRRMFMLPVALSVFATFMSGVSLIGKVTDIYLYGFMAAVGTLGIAISYLISVVTVVPLLYPLQLTGIYEYLELRFHSNVLRQATVVIGMVQTLFYLAAALLSPALALQVGSGIPMWMSVGVVGFIGTVYTAIGGMKSVIWTDAFQCVVMIGGVLTIIFKGFAILSGAGFWNTVSSGDRAIFNDFSLDPRTRNTWWGGIIGFGFLGLSTHCNQASLQRISSMRSVKEAKYSFLINVLLQFVYCIMIVIMAWLMYAYFVQIRCDPYKAGFISNPNQLPPYYVMHAMKDLPGIGGLYMGVIFSASLSTLSSGISAMAANTVEDLLQKPLKHVKESIATLITKVFVLVYGILIIGLTFAANSATGPLNQIVGSVAGAFGGPVLGIFILGTCFPPANKYGALIGGGISFIFNLWITLGSQIYKSFQKPLPFPPTDKCFFNNSKTDFKNYINPESYSTNETYDLFGLNNSSIPKSYLEAGSRNFGFFLYDISFMWYSMIGTLNTIFLGIIISYCTRKYCASVTDEKLIFSFVRRFWLTRMSKVKSESNDEDVNDTPMVAKSSNTHDMRDGHLMKQMSINT